MAGRTVATAAHRQQQLVVASEGDSASNVGGIGGAHDHGGALVEQSVPDAPPLLIVHIARQIHCAAQTAPQIPKRPGIADLDCTIHIRLMRHYPPAGSEMLL